MRWGDDLANPKSIKTNPELACYFCECTEMEADLLENLLSNDTNLNYEKYALSKCMK